MNPDQVDLVAPVSVRLPFWRSIVAVAWSFIGIRKNSEFQEDLSHITPLASLGSTTKATGHCFFSPGAKVY